jgi:hypothetical protein
MIGVLAQLHALGPEAPGYQELLLRCCELMHASEHKAAKVGGPLGGSYGAARALQRWARARQGCRSSWGLLPAAAASLA